MNRIDPLGTSTYPDELKATPVPLLFLDIESTSLRVPWRSASRLPWEIGAIRRATNGSEQEYGAFITDVDLTDADPISLSIGGFYDRHPQYTGHRYIPQGQTPGAYALGTDREARLHTEHDVACLVEWLARGAHIIGAVPDFDTSTLDAMLARYGLAWPGHYHLVCAEVYAAGAIGWTPPYDSKALSAALGVDPAAYPQHEALADARWCRDLYDAARVWEGGKITQPR